MHGPTQYVEEIFWKVATRKELDQNRVQWRTRVKACFHLYPYSGGSGFKSPPGDRLC